MIEKKVYDELKKKYGEIASWAIWKEPGETPKSNMDDVSMFDSDRILKSLNPDYVFVGLSGSNVGDGYMDMKRPWHNLHSSNPKSNDFKLRHALMDTPYWGAYLTVAIKDMSPSASGMMPMYLTENSEVIKRNMKELREEIDTLGTRPTVVCFGKQTYELVKLYLGKDFVVKQVTHYSSLVGKDAFRAGLLKELSDK